MKNKMSKRVKQLVAMLLIAGLTVKPGCIAPFLSYADEIADEIVDEEAVLEEAVLEEVATDSDADEEILASDSDAQETEQAPEGKEEVPVELAAVENVALARAANYEAMIGEKGYPKLGNAFVLAQPGETITLMKDVVVVGGGSTYYTIKKDRCVTLDLNGHNLGFDKNQYIRINQGELHLTGEGRLYGTSKTPNPIKMYVNSLGEVNNFCRLIVDEGVTLEGWEPITIDQTSSTSYGVDEGDISVIVKGTLNSVRDKNGTPGAGIYINGQITAPNPVPEIVIDDGATITSEGLGIYAAGYADTTVRDASITGRTGGIEIRAGKLTVEEPAQITSLTQTASSKPNGSGSTTSGAGIAIAQHGTKLPIEVTIRGGEISGGVPVYESNPENNEEEAIQQVSLKIEGGTFTVTGNGTQPVYSEDCEGFITGGSYSVAPGHEYIANDYMRVNAVDDTGSYTVEPYQFAFEEGTTTTVTLDAADENKKTYSFQMLGDYEDYEVVSSHPEVAKVATSADGDHTYTIEAVAAGTAQITAKKKNADGTATTLTIDVVVQMGGADLKVANGAVELDVSQAEAKAPAQPEGMAPEQFAQITMESTSKMDEAKASIAGNTAVTGAETSGFDQIQNLDELKADIPAGVEVEIYPKQTLEELCTDLESTTVVDASGNAVTSYTPVISRMVYDISPYMRVKGTETETRLEQVEGMFRFRIPVPVGVSASARYAIVEHEGDNQKSYRIEGTDPSRYITVTTSHFSPFILTFSRNSLYVGGGSSGGSGGGVAADTWHQDAKGWWIRKADGTCPVNCWYQAVWNGKSEWYHFDAEGYMQTGWFTDVDGHRYYLHPISDGAQGHMYVGWQFIDGAWYYFRTESGGPQGSLLTNGITPDGGIVNEWGIRVG